MQHESNIRYIDLIISPFLCQLSVGFNKVFYLCFSLFFAYQEWKPFYGVFDYLGVLLYSIITLRYLFLILLFIFVFAAAISLFGSIRKKGVQGKHIFEFNEDEFIEKTDYNESKTKYTAVSKVFTRFGSIYIALPGMHWHILPKRDFSSAESRDELLSLLRSKINA